MFVYSTSTLQISPYDHFAAVVTEATSRLDALEARRRRFDEAFQRYLDELSESELGNRCIVEQRQLTFEELVALEAELERRAILRWLGAASFQYELRLDRRARRATESQIAIVDMPRWPNAPSA